MSFFFLIRCQNTNFLIDKPSRRLDEKGEGAAKMLLLLLLLLLL